MNVEMRRRKILRVIQDKLEAETLVDFQIPYEDILSLLHQMLKEGLITRSNEGSLTLTPAGQAMLASEQKVRSAKSFVDKLADARAQQIDSDLVFLP